MSKQGATAADRLRATMPKASASLIGWGIGLLVIGQVIYGNGRQQAIEAALETFSTDDGGAAMTVGGVLSLAGLIILIYGVTNLAKAVDYLARRQHARDFVDAELDDGEDVE